MKRALLAAGAVAVLIGGGFGAFAIYRQHQFRDIHGSSSVEFVTTAPRPPRAAASQLAAGAVGDRESVHGRRS